MTGPTGPPEAELAQVADAHARLLAGVSALTDEQAAGPSLLPTWTRAEVLTHLARNADGTRRTVEGLLRGEVVAKYPGGAEQRSAEIAAGRGRPPSELVADLARSVEWLHDTWAAVPPEAWAPSAPDGTTAETARAGMWNRHREVEVHHVDLDLGYSPDDWPAAFTAQLLARTVGELAGRVAAELPPPDATWVLWADDLRLAWAVTVEAGSVELVAVSEVGRPDVLVRGAGRRVAAWLVGRLALDESGLAVAGNRVLAVGLPGWFPLR